MVHERIDAFLGNVKLQHGAAAGWHGICLHAVHCSFSSYTRSRMEPMTWAEETPGPTLTKYIRIRSPGFTRTASLSSRPLNIENACSFFWAMAGSVPGMKPLASVVP